MIYEYACITCKERVTASRSIADRNNCPECPECGSETEKHIFTATMTQFPQWNLDYYCPALGQGITSMRQRKYLMDKRGLMDADEMGTPDFGDMAEKADAVQNYKPKSQQAPAELKEAMVKESHTDLL